MDPSVTSKFWFELNFTVLIFQLVGFPFSPLKAALDFKHISDRYHRGRVECDKMMGEKHCFIRATSLVLAHSQIVQMQANLGSDTFLG